MRSPRERSRARATKRPWGAACAAIVALGTVATAVSCATQESHDFSDNPCVAGGCVQPTTSVSSSVGSSSSSSSSGCPDAGGPSFTTDIYNAMLDTGGTAKCTTAGPCHGNVDGGGQGGLVLPPNDPATAYTNLTASTLKTAPLPNAAASKRYVVPGDPGHSGMTCNMNVSSGGTNPFGQCGHGMPNAVGMDLDVEQIDTIATWISCGAPNN